MRQGRLRALGVLAGSLCIAIALTALGEQPFSWRLVAASAILKLAAFVSSAALAWISLWVAGARPGAGGFVSISAYVFAGWLLIFAFLYAIDEGALRLARPELFSQIMIQESSGQDTQKLKVLLGSEGTYAMKALLDTDKGWADVIHTPGFLWIASMAALRGFVTFAWLIAVWRALRHLLGMSWSRAILSLAVFLWIGLMAALLAVFFQMAPIMVDTGRWLEKWSY